MLAQRRGLRIHEVPVDWVDDPDSRVDILRTAFDDLAASRGCRRRAARALPGDRHRQPLAYALLFLPCATALSAAGANAAALATTAVGNTAANRRFTFGLRGREALLPDHVRGFHWSSCSRWG